ncbi:hypothetical protein LOC67_23525 [Stieleria sp. JC731]|uniref:hypothetical protein n=1 Tax=Pirellulaceae TaxID=2691357 RepID=UPI001E385129|nr:hypothetical protein [Stieleria sp. JC731]MCC9603531.1 hypothetical protein [Stieleria sp. JC731]
MKQQPLLDYIASMDRKERGMQLAANKSDKFPLLLEARQIAEALAIAHPKRETNADKVSAVLVARGIDLGPAAGSLFRGRQWQFTGKRIKSAKVSNHAREIKVWRLVSVDA